MLTVEKIHVIILTSLEKNNYLLYVKYVNYNILYLVIIKSKKFYPELPEKKVIEDRWKKTDVPDFQDWKELKVTGVKYRVDVPSASMFRILRSRKSLVNVLDNFVYN